MTRIGTLNARGLRDKSKRNQIFSFFKSKELDLVFVQETHGTPEIENVWCSEWGGNIFYSHHNSASRGVMILCSNSISVRSSSSDDEGRWVLAEIDLNEIIVTVVNIYAPNMEREQIEFYDNLDSYLMARTNTDNVIIGGDFNVHLETIDKRGARVEIKKSKESITHIMDNYNLIDIWREKHKLIEQYTWENQAMGVMTRLDYYLLSNALQKDVKLCEITESILTDHKMVILQLGYNLKKHKRPRILEVQQQLAFGQNLQ